MSLVLGQHGVRIVAVPIGVMQLLNIAQNVPSDGETEPERGQCPWENNVHFYPTLSRNTALLFTRHGLLAFQMLWNIQGVDKNRKKLKATILTYCYCFGCLMMHIYRSKHRVFCVKDVGNDHPLPKYKA